MSEITGFNKDSQGIFIVKDPTANVAYTLDWTNYLETGVIITSASVTIQTLAGDTSPLAHPTSPATDITITDGNKVSMRLHNGESGKVYNIACTIVNDAGDTDTRHFRVVVKDAVLV
jgi:hypothetical protein